jgi:hypothetical protein
MVPPNVDDSQEISIRAAQTSDPDLILIEITVITKYLADAEADPGEFCRAGQTA